MNSSPPYRATRPESGTTRTIVRGGVEGRVLHRDHELAGDDAYGVEPVLGERAAPQAVLEQEHCPGLTLGLHGQGEHGADVQPVEVRVLWP